MEKQIRYRQPGWIAVRTLCRWLLIAAGLLPFAASAASQAPEKYPSRPVRILVPFAPGGATDFVARIVQPRLAEELGQPVVLDNRAGASGNIALEMAARATPDGYTALFSNVGVIAINPALFKSFPINTLRDLRCLSVVADMASVLVVHSSVPAKTVKEFIEYAKARPGKINYGSSSPGSLSRLGMEIFANKSGISLVHVPYKGAAAVSVALLSAEVQSSFVSLAPVLANIRSGQLRALASRTRERPELLPDLPTLKELGYPELTDSAWQGLYIAAGTPMPVLKTLHAAITKVVEDPRVAERLKAGSATIIRSGSLENCAAFSKSEVAFWGKLVKQVGLAGMQ